MKDAFDRGMEKRDLYGELKSLPQGVYKYTGKTQGSLTEGMTLYKVGIKYFDEDHRCKWPCGNVMLLKKEDIELVSSEVKTWEE